MDQCKVGLEVVFTEVDTDPASRRSKRNLAVKVNKMGMKIKGLRVKFDLKGAVTSAVEGAVIGALTGGMTAGPTGAVEGGVKVKWRTISHRSGHRRRSSRRRRS